MRPWTRGLFSIKSQRANKRKARKGPSAGSSNVGIPSRRYENVIHNRLPVLVLMYVLFEAPTCHLQQQVRGTSAVFQDKPISTLEMIPIIAILALYVCTHGASRNCLSEYAVCQSQACTVLLNNFLQVQQ